VYVSSHITHTHTHAHTHTHTHTQHNTSTQFTGARRAVEEQTEALGCPLRGQSKILASLGTESRWPQVQSSTLSKQDNINLSPQMHPDLLELLKRLECVH